MCFVLQNQQFQSRRSQLGVSPNHSLLDVSCLTAPYMSQFELNWSWGPVQKPLWVVLKLPLIDHNPNGSCVQNFLPYFEHMMYVLACWLAQLNQMLKQSPCTHLLIHWIKASRNNSLGDSALRDISLSLFVTKTKKISLLSIFPWVVFNMMHPKWWNPWVWLHLLYKKIS